MYRVRGRFIGYNPFCISYEDISHTISRNELRLGRRQRGPYDGYNDTLFRSLATS